MATIFAQATLTKTTFTSDPSIFRKPDSSLTNKLVLVDCQAGKEAIIISSYRYRGYHCSIWIRDANYNLTGHGKGSTNFNALVNALNEIGITFKPLMRENLTPYEQTEGVMHSIADALAIGHPRVITHAWT